MAANISVYHAHPGTTRMDESPYGITARQRKKWRQLWHLATTHRDIPGQPQDEDTAWRMTPIEGPGPIAGPGDLSPILSRVIKVARFIIVQKALWLDPNPEEIIAVWQKKSNCAQYPIVAPTSPITSSNPQPIVNIRRQNRGKTFQEHVEWMVQRFIVHGTHSPIQTLQDWRTARAHYIKPWRRARIQAYHIYQGRFLRICPWIGRGHTPDIVRDTVRDGAGRYSQYSMARDLRRPHAGHGGIEFLRDQRTQWPVGPKWMIGWLRAEPAMQKEFTVQRQARRLHMPKVAQYLERVA
ncbi:uncharacterized protein ATNIH1004_000009 [Aspergillus tanneri]|uniref:Uncharacterized protein n=1 Tax=Aspergillus tanneri TaxID=1220188 RepID=A0A5M9MVH6_9EURO|nr:uncharacterized protein ATNIH1004_000009 [Aspergillus tanneri]KAA8651131.1 hypothetical protein ATNIH1004_000009 [Aspergillus tanneri]